MNDFEKWLHDKRITYAEDIQKMRKSMKDTHPEVFAGHRAYKMALDDILDAYRKFREANHD